MKPFGALRFLIITLSFLTFFFIFSKNAHAFGQIITPEWRDENTDGVTVQITGINQSNVYVCLKNDGHCFDLPAINPGDDFPLIEKAVVDHSVTIEVCGNDNNLKQGACGPDDFFNVGDYDIWLYQNTDKNDTCGRSALNPPGYPCTRPSDSITNNNFEINRVYPDVVLSPHNPTEDNEIIFDLRGTRRPANRTNRNDYDFWLKQGGTKIVNEQNQAVFPGVGFQIDKNFGKLAPDTYHLTVREAGGDNFVYYPDVTIIVGASGSPGSIVGDGSPSGGGSGGLGENPCRSGECNTALGSLPTNIKPFASRILSFAIGIAGGIALIIMVIGSIRVLTSSGDQQRLNGGREMLVAAVAGLLFLVFSTLILRFIGLTILGLS